MPRLGDIGEQYFDSNGDPLGGGKLEFFASGTTTPATTYSNDGETIANANPVILSADGRQPDIFYTGSLKIVLKDKDDVIIETRDPVSTASGGSGGAANDYWNFQAVQTRGWTAVAGSYYFARQNLALTMTLPAGTDNDRVGIAIIGDVDDSSSKITINDSGATEVSFAGYNGASLGRQCLELIYKDSQWNIMNVHEFDVAV